MTNQTKGNLLVTAQFVLIAIILILPSGTQSPAWLYFTGFAMLIAGIAILITSFVQLGSSLTAHPIPRTEAKLIERGLYRVIRHPIYTGLLLTMLGGVIQTGNVAKYLVWGMLLGLLTYKARFEEVLLTQTYSSYSEYMKRTGRFLPRLK